MKTEGVNRAVKSAIQEAVSAGLKAGVLYAERKPKDAYKDTEKRLYAYPLLMKKIVEDKAFRRAGIARRNAGSHDSGFAGTDRSGRIRGGNAGQGAQGHCRRSVFSFCEGEVSGRHDR